MSNPVIYGLHHITLCARGAQEDVDDLRAVSWRHPHRVRRDGARRVRQRRAVRSAGMALLLPPWFEERRQEIVAMLEPSVVPEANRPAGAQPASGVAPSSEPAPGVGGATASRRTNAIFIGGDVPTQ